MGYDLGEKPHGVTSQGRRDVTRGRAKQCRDGAINSRRREKVRGDSGADYSEGVWEMVIKVAA